jgi:thioredoxin 1
MSAATTPMTTAMTDAAAPYLDAEQFRSCVDTRSGLSVIDFTAEWCPPCRQLAPHVDALARELAPAVLVAKVDADAHPALAARFGVRGLPTVLLFQDGEVVDRIVGALPAAQLRARIQAARRPDPLG